MGRFLSYIATFCVLFALTVLFMAAVDALPEPLSSGGAQRGSGTVAAPIPGEYEAPVRVVAKTVGLDVVVLNPTDTDIEVLDEALLKGAVHYPESALLGEKGTMLLFGHSSYLPIVTNQNYKAFNGIQNLKPGEVISAYSATGEYRYRVVGVRFVNAEDEPLVPLPNDAQHLTLITCDSFGTKSDRFVVTADFVGTYPLP